MDPPRHTIAAFAFAMGFFLGVPGCSEVGPADNNQNQYNPTPEIAEIIVTPHPDRILVAYRGYLYAVDLTTYAPVILQGIHFPYRFAFTHDGRRALVYSARQRTVHVLDLERRTYTHPGAFTVALAYHRIQVTRDDRVVVFTHPDGPVAFHDLDSGALLHSQRLATEIVDSNSTPDGRMFVATGVASYYAVLHFADLETFETQYVLFRTDSPRRLLRIVGNLGLLANPRSSNDPDALMVVDLHSRQAVGSAPVGGPVAPVPDSRKVIGIQDFCWGDGRPMDEMGSYMALVDLDTMAVEESFHVGWYDASYRLSRDGGTVVAIQWWGGMFGPLTVLDLETGEKKVIETPQAGFVDLVVTGDGRDVFLLTGEWHSGRVYRVDVDQGTVREVVLTFDTYAIDLLPDDSRLIVTGPSGRDFHVVDTDTDQVVAQFMLPLPSFP